MVKPLFSEVDHRRVTEAVGEAERLSDGEIVTVVAARSDAYHDVGLHYSVLAMLAVPALLALLPPAMVERGATLMLGWNAQFSRAMAMIALFALLASFFLIVRFALAWRPLRLALTPRRTKERRVHRRACEIFRTGCELKTRGRTGILLYVSLEEKRAVILADRAIAERTEPETWGEALALLIDGVKAGRPGDGMVAAIEKVGAVLQDVLPPTSHDVNELPDRLVEL